MRINADPKPASRFSPSVAASDGIFVTWSDERNGEDVPDIYGQVIERTGTGVFQKDVRIRSSNDTTSQYYPAALLDENGEAFAAWSDDRMGDGCIYIYAQRLDVSGNRMATRCKREFHRLLTSAMLPCHCFNWCSLAAGRASWATTCCKTTCIKRGSTGQTSIIINCH
jgi:hypothetical protein